MDHHRIPLSISHDFRFAKADFPLSVNRYFCSLLVGLSGSVYSIIRSFRRSRTTLLSCWEIFFCPNFLDNSDFDIGSLVSRLNTLDLRSPGSDSGCTLICSGGVPRQIVVLNPLLIVNSGSGKPASLTTTNHV